ncbi:MAG: potassium transporter TrkG [Rikenellaceae bacterium]
MSLLNKLFIYRKRLVMPYVLRLLRFLDVACYLMSLLFLIALIYEHGFRISPHELEWIHGAYDFTWFTFILSSIAHITLDFRQTRLKYKNITWIVTFALLLMLIPRLFAVPIASPMLHSVWRLLESRLLCVVLLSLLSLLQLSNGVVSLLNRRVNPSFILSVSFFVFILLGTAMLMLPRATVNGISFVDALFMSTSAICVTGLATVDLATTFTPMGVLFILILIQVGGLGVMTLTSFFAMSFMGNSSLFNQVMVSDMVSSKSLGSLFSTLLYILGFTFIIECVGAAIIFFDIHGTLGMTLQDEIGFAVFHSISAFCNAGFSTMSANLGDEMLMSGHNTFYMVITLLIILGGIGFPILVNLYETLKYHTRRVYERYIVRSQRALRRVHLYDINTRIVIMMTLLLLGVATLSVAIFEWNNGFAAMPTLDKVVHSLFNAACPRTAGFSSVAVSSFSLQTILILLLLMVIGGGTQSTAGGIKVNVFAVVMLNVRAILYGRDRVTVFNRELSHDSVRRSNSTLVLYMIFVGVAIFILTLLEPQASLLAIVFEVISALSTVGSSLDLTPTLGSDSKLVIVALMFIGRVGVLTIASSLIKQRQVLKYKYPSGNIIIN